MGGPERGSGSARPRSPFVGLLLAIIVISLCLSACGGSSGSSSGSTTTTAAAATPPAGTWTASTPVRSGPFTNLVYVQCNGSNNCYADGFSQGNSVFTDFLQHWDGHAWTSSEGPVGTGGPLQVGELDCLPSGFCVVPFTTNKVMIDQVVGNRWTAMPVADPTTPQLPFAGANAAACYSETLCFAVGGISNRAQDHASSLGLVWNAHRWQPTVLAPQGPDPVQSLLSVSCGSQSFCLAVGYTARGPADTGPEHTAIAARWDGSRWSSAPMPPGTRLDDIVCISPSSCLAVGANGSSGLVLHWNGSGWTKEPVPPSNDVFAINCASEDLCMAVQRPDANRPLGTKPVLLRWHGHWSNVTGYPAPAAYLSGVSCYDGGCVIVGQSRATPSRSATDVNGAQATAAFYNFKSSGTATTTATTAATTSSAAAAPTTVTSAAPTANHVVIGGLYHATLTARPNECSVSGNVHTIQIKGLDSQGVSTVLTVTDQKNYAQVLRGIKLYFYKSGKLTVTPSTATFTNVVMPESDGFGHGTITVNGTVAC